MIGKVKIGKSFGGICRYVFQEDKQALVHFGLQRLPKPPVPFRADEEV